MSHFVVTVLVKPEALQGGDEEEAVRALLAPYDENTEVAPYQTTCWCVGRKARADARAAAIAGHGTVEELRTSFQPKRAEILGAEHANTDYFDLPSEVRESLDEAWRKHLAPAEEAERAAFAAHPAKDEADPACDECSGTGKRVSTRNPKSKWDWWTVRGRWSGFLSAEGTRGNADVPAFLQRLAAEGNVAPVSDLLARWNPEELTPFAVVTPDGKWHERGEMGWFACVSDEKPRAEWRPQVQALMEAHRDCIAVAVDCHI